MLLTRMRLAVTRLLFSNRLIPAAQAGGKGASREDLRRLKHLHTGFDI